MTDSRVVYLGSRTSPPDTASDVPRVLPAFAHALNRIPGRPAGFTACVAHLQDDPGKLAARAFAVRALQKFRDALFHAPGRELEMRMLWRESLAAACFARLLSVELQVDSPLLTGAALMHRLGEVLALRALADAEFCAGQRLTGPVLQEVTAAQNEPLAARAMTLWALSDELRALLHQVREESVLASGTDVARYLVLSQLLAIEHVQAGRFTPGLIETACEQAQVPLAPIDLVRGSAPAVDALLLRAAPPMGPVSFRM